MMYFGADMHKKVCRAAILNDEGDVVDEFSFMNSVNGIRDFMMRIEVFRDEALVAVESTANLWVGLYDFLEDGGVWLYLPPLPRLGLSLRPRLRLTGQTSASLLSF
jgi:transposase